MHGYGTVYTGAWGLLETVSLRKTYSVINCRNFSARSGTSWALPPSMLELAGWILCKSLAVAWAHVCRQRGSSKSTPETQVILVVAYSTKTCVPNLSSASQRHLQMKRTHDTPSSWLFFESDFYQAKSFSMKKPHYPGMVAQTCCPRDPGNWGGEFCKFNTSLCYSMGSVSAQLSRAISK